MTIVIAVAVVLVAAVLLAAGIRTSLRMRQRALRERFGPEYERLVAEKGPRRAEAELAARQRRAARLEIRALTPDETLRYATKWKAVQEGFVDDPPGAVLRAAGLITAVQRDVGYPADDPDEALAAVSVDHARAMADYQRARELAVDGATTEQLRQALIGYRVLFRELTKAAPKVTVVKE